MLEMIMGYWLNSKKGGSRTSREFIELLETKMNILKEHADNDKTHRVFDFKDEYDIIRGIPLEFVETKAISSRSFVDKTVNVTSMKNMKNKVHDLWCKALMLCWFSYIKGDQLDSLKSLWRYGGMDQSFFVALNILRQLDISEDNSGLLYASLKTRQDEFHSTFPCPDELTYLNISGHHKFNSCENKLEPWFQEVLHNLIKDETLLHQVNEDIVFLIPYCLFVMCPLVYQMEGNVVVTKKSNYGLIVRSFLFECAAKLYVESDVVIINIWRVVEDKGKYYHYNPTYKKDYINHMLSLQYDPDKSVLVKGDVEDSDFYNASETDEVYDKLVDKYEEHICYRLLVKYRAFVDKEHQNILTDSLNSYQIDTNDSAAPNDQQDDTLSILRSARRYDYNINIVDILQKRVSSRDIHRLTDVNQNVHVRPPLLSTNENDNPITPVVLLFVYRILDLFRGHSRIIFNARSVVIGNNFNYNFSTPDTTDIYDNLKMRTFIEKIEKVIDFISLLKILKIYNHAYYDQYIRSIYKLDIFVVNNPTYENDIGAEGFFKDISMLTKPQYGAHFKAIELLDTTKSVLNMILFDNTYGMTSLCWFQAIIRNTLIDINNEFAVNNKNETETVIEEIANQTRLI